MTDWLDPFEPLPHPIGFVVAPAAPPPIAQEARITVEGAALLRSKPRPKSWGESKADGLRRRRAERKQRAGGG
jgi:hypothetical protein